MSSDDLENGIKPEISSKRMKLGDKESVKPAKILSDILQREIETEIKLRKDDLDIIEENIFLTKQCLLRLKQGAVTDYYKEKSQKECLQYPPHPAIKDTFLGKVPRNYDYSKNLETVNIEDIFIKQEIKKESDNYGSKEEKEDVNEMEDSKSAQSVFECTKPPCYIAPNPVKVEAVKPPDPRGYVSKKHLRIVVGNVSKWLAPEESTGATHKWTVYTKSADPSVDLSEFVSKVIFFLHPSYKPNDVVTVVDPPFKLTRRGWGEFPLKARFHFKNTLDVPVDVMHVLKLDQKHTGLETFGSETTLSVWIHSSSKEDVPDQKEEEVDGYVKPEEDNVDIDENYDIYTKGEAYTSEINEFVTSPRNYHTESNIEIKPFTSDTLSFFSEDGNKSLDLTDFLACSPKGSVNVECTDLSELVPADFDNKISSLETQPSCDDYFDECNVVESEVVIDCDDDISANNGNNDELMCHEITKEFNDFKTQENIEIYSEKGDCSNTSFPSVSKSSDPGCNSIIPEGKFSIASMPSSSVKVESLQQNLFSSQLVQGYNNVQNYTSSFQESTDDSTNNQKNIVKGQVISVLKSSSNAVNVFCSKTSPKQVFLRKLNGISPTLQEPNNQGANSFANSPSSKSESVSLLSPNVCLPKNNVKTHVLLSEAAGVQSLSKLNNSTILNELSPINSPVKQNKAVILVNSSSLPSINTPQKNTGIINKLYLSEQGPSTSIIGNIKKKKRTLNNKEVKSTLIMLQKENGQVILRKEAKFKECKDNSGTVGPLKEKCKGSVIDPKVHDGVITKSNVRIKHQENLPTTTTLNTALSNAKPSFITLKLPLDNLNNLSSNSLIGGKKVVILNQAALTPSNMPPNQKREAPLVSLLKKSSLDKSFIPVKAVDTKNNLKESSILKRCPTQNTEVAVSWLMKRFPLVDSRAQLSGFRIKHPYCAKSRDDFLNWPFPKQRAAEWMRAKSVGRILSKLPGITEWTTLEIWDWARIRAFTPMKINSVQERPTKSPDIQYYYNQPTEEIIDYIKRCTDLKEKEVVDIVSSDESPDNLTCKDFAHRPTSQRTEFNLMPKDNEIPFEPELKDIRGFINKCQSNVKAQSCAEEICPEVLYPAAERLLISAFYSFAEDIIRRAHNASWVRHCDEPPSEINVEDIKCAVLSRKEFDFLVPLKDEKKERPPITVLPNFS